MSTTPAQCPLRHDITAPPKFMQNLPIDKRGYPVPWFVDWINGEPEFRAMDARKFARAIVERLCWTCGHKLFGEEVFVIGPMCAVNRISAEPPSHRQCAEYSAVNCPFLSKPHMVRREDENFNSVKRQGAGVMIERNPGVTLLWYTRSHRLQQIRGQGVANDGILFQIGRPLKTEWYAHGRKATRKEVLEAIESGLPILREVAAKHDGPEGMMLLENQINTAMRLVPR